MEVSVVIVGQDKVVAALSALGGPEMDARIGSGLQAWGQVIQTAARRNLADHHFTGRAEQFTTVEGPVVSGSTVGVTIGIHGGLAPEGRPLEYGWASSSGKQPPSQPIYEWLTGSSAGRSVLTGFGASVNTTKAGFIPGSRSARVSSSEESTARGLAFLIARSIGRRGYSFAALHWLSKAASDTIEDGKAAFLRVVGR